MAVMTDASTRFIKASNLLPKPCSISFPSGLFPVGESVGDFMAQKTPQNLSMIWCEKHSQIGMTVGLM